MLKNPRSVFLASVLAATLGVAAVPAAAQSSSSGAATQGGGSTTGALPDNSLAGQRQGAMTGGTVNQGGSGSTGGSTGSDSAGSSMGTSGAANPTGALPDNSLAGQRQGAMTGGTVNQGGSGSTGGSTGGSMGGDSGSGAAGTPKQGSGQ